MSDQSLNPAESTQKAVPSFADFCVYDAWKSSDEKKDKSYVGIKVDGKEPRIYFPMGYRSTKPSEDVCKQDFYRLVAVLSDKSLQSYFSEEDLKKSQLDFPFYAYLSVLQYYLDFGYFVESETIYKKGFSGKISWPRTVKKIKPQVVKNEDDPSHIRYQVVYLNLITRKTSYREDNLITLVHKFCVKESARLIGLLYGVSENEVEDSELLFDYELFAEVIQDKIASTFNDKHLELFQAMLKMVRYLGKKDNCGEDGKKEEPFFGVNTFAPMWEGMVDRIFATVSREEKRNKYNPHLKFVAFGSANTDGEKYQDDDNEGTDEEHKRSTLRPDTIMQNGENNFILDSKYYKYGLKGNLCYLPGADSVCKQMAYAEYVERNAVRFGVLNELYNVGEHVFNAFVLPYCVEADNRKLPPDADSETRPFKMRYAGYIYGDWKKVPDAQHPYHKIACILLDVKSVVQNYVASGAERQILADLISSKTSG